MKHRWLLAPAQPLLRDALAADLGVSPLLAQCLVNRGLVEPARARAFLEPRLRQLADPAHLPNLHTAVDRLWRALDQAQPLVIFGSQLARSAFESCPPIFSSALE